MSVGVRFEVEASAPFCVIVRGLSNEPLTDAEYIADDRQIDDYTGPRYQVQCDGRDIFPGTFDPPKEGAVMRADLCNLGRFGRGEHPVACGGAIHRAGVAVDGGVKSQEAGSGGSAAVVFAASRMSFASSSISWPIAM